MRNEEDIKEKILISVIIPVYKVEHYLERCIDSIIKQTYECLEIILIDDGSPDECPKICDNYAAQDSRIRVIHQKNQGLSSARNAGINIAKGEYISFVDSDDLIHPQMLEILLLLCKESDSEISLCGYFRFSSNSELKIKKILISPPYNIYTSREILKQIHSYEGWLYTPACNKLYRKELFDHIRYPVGKINEDEFTTYKLFDLATNIVVTMEPLYFYYKNINSITGNKNYLESEDIYEAYREQYKYFLDKGYLELLLLVQKSFLNRVISRYRMADGQLELQKKLKEKYDTLYKKTKKGQLGIGYWIFKINPKIYFYLLKRKKHEKQ